MTPGEDAKTRSFRSCVGHRKLAKRSRFERIVVSKWEFFKQFDKG